MYKFLIFDADHTLLDFDKAEKIAITEILEDIGHDYDDSTIEIYKNINTSLWKKFEKNEINQNEIKNERFRLFFEQTGIKYSYLKASEDYLLYLSRGSYLIPGAYDLINKLKNDYLLGLLSNGISKVQHPRLERSVLNELFDYIVISGDVGINKPDPRIFNILADKADFHDKNMMLMIGDSLTSDILGGMNYKIDTCWYNPFGKLNVSGIIPTYEIEKLDELLDILE